MLISNLTLFFQKIVAQMPKFGYFGKRRINFLILTKFCLYPILKVLISNLALVLENFKPKCSNLEILGQNYLLFNFSKISYVLYFECADFKSDICFRKFQVQILKFEYFGPKSINFQILTRFCLYAISKVLLSNMTFAFCGS